jgi:hypothetical protein
MSVKTLMFLTSALTTAGLVIEPLAANADGMSQLGTWGKPSGMGAGVSNLTCDGVPGVDNMNIRQMDLPRTPGAGNVSAFRPNVNAGTNPNIGANSNIGPNPISAATSRAISASASRSTSLTTIATAAA